MKLLGRRLYKLFSVISGLSLVFNSLLPASLLSVIIAPPAYALEAPTGATGAIDATGATGITADTGVSGPSGATGDVGPTGASAEIGPSATTGTSGSTGATGSTGEILDGISTESAQMTPPTETITATVTTPENTPASEVSPTVNETGPPEQTATPTPTSTPTPAPEQPETGTVSVITNPSSQQQLDLSTYDPTSGTLKNDFAPTDTVLIIGTGFKANHTYTVTISSSDPPAITNQTEFTVTTDNDGVFKQDYTLDGNYRPNYTVVVTNQGGHLIATTTFTDTQPASGDLQQCRNGSATSPNNCLDLGSGQGWVSGNAGGSNSHYVEGFSIPYREILTNLPTGTSITLTLGYDITHSSKHAIDFLTHYNRLQPHSPFGHAAETITPTDGVSGLSATVSTYPIPAPSSIGSPSTDQPTSSFNSLPSGERVMTLFGGTINNVVYVSQGNLTDAQAETQIAITFTADNSTAVLAWGGHIAREIDWGLNNSAGGISGSPYHMRQIGWTLNNLGNTDRSLSADAVEPPSSITIIKDAQPDSAQDFSFTTVGNGLSNFTLDDDGGSDSTYSNTTTFNSLLAGTYTVTETTVSGWSLASKTCISDGTGSTSSQITNGVSVVLVAGENVTCTFTNSLQSAHLTLVKTITNDNGGTAAATDWTLSASGSTPISGTTGSGAVTNAEVNGGTYTLSESGPTGYTAGSWSCTGGSQNGNQITLAAGESATCTINNNDNAPQLHLRKTITTDNGGTDLATDWTLSATGALGSPTNLSGSTPVDSTTGFKADTYSLAETGGPTGYNAGAWDCGAATMPDATHVTVPLGGNVTCTINNNDNAPALHLRKVVVNNNGGTAVAANWTLSSFGLTPLSGTTPVDSDATFKQGTYTLSETGPSGYTASAWDCVGGTQSGSNITVGLGQSATCTITNTDIAPTLKLVKVVTNDNGGNKTPANWTLTATGTGGFSDTGDSTTFHTVKANVAYALSESTVIGYDAGTFSCDGGTLVGQNLTLGLDSDVTCTITNNDQAAHLIVIKHVDNGTTGATYTAADFTMTINDVTASGGNSFAGSESPGTNKTLTTVGSYTVTESGPPGYTKTASTDCSGTIALGETKTCTITNTAIAPQLKLVKTVTNDNGGTKQVSDFPLFIDGNGVTSGVFNSVTVGSHTATETSDSGYSASVWGTDCASNGSITLALGDSKTCTITNNDKAAHLIVIKHVINDNGGTKSAANFSTTISGVTTVTPTAPGAESPGVDNILTTVGSYSVDEGTHTGYAKSLSTDCTGSIALGETKTCTITNDDIQPKLTLTKIVKNDNGGNAVISDFPLFVNTTPVTSGVQNGFDAGTYTASETNLGGYTASAWSPDCAPNGSITLAVGDVKSCSIVNDDQPAHIVLNKVVNKNHGGTADVNDFGISIDDGSVLSGSTHDVTSNTSHTLNETGLTGYEFVSLTGDSKCPSVLGGGVTLNEGETVNCTITNEDIAPTLHLRKTVTKDNGGTALDTAWTLTATGTLGSPTNLSGSTPVNSGADFKADTYTLGETGPSGYSASGWTCTGDVKNSGNSITLGLSQSATCTINNDDNAPSLTLIKHVTNDNGGNAATTDWTLSADGPTSISGAGGVVSGASFEKGTYALSESTGPSGYTAGTWSCTGGTFVNNQITLGLGDQATCEITNDDQPATLIVIKHVENNNIGTAVADDFTMNVTGTNVSDSSFAGAEDPGTSVTLDAGSYSVSETGITGYSGSYSNDCSGAIANGQTKTCTVTNTRDIGTITVNKVLVPANDPGLFTLKIDGSAAGTGTDVGNGGTTGAITVGSDLHSVNEVGGTNGTDLSNYLTTYYCTGGEGSLRGTGTNISDIDVGSGDDIVCTFTNTRKTGTLLVHKVADTNGDGQYDSTDPTNFKWGTESAVLATTDMGTPQTLITGNYNVYENIVPGYQFTGWFPNGFIDDNEIRYSCERLPQGPQYTQLPTDIAVTTDQTELTLCNKFINPILTITKENNTGGADISPGSGVLYTLTVTATQSAAFNVTVTDLLPAGFTYRAGSWTANSNKRGDIKSPLGPTTEPTYASPGVWKLGNMIKDESVTLTYIADVSSAQQAGLYHDLAWAAGCKTDTNCSDVLSNATDPGFVADHYVGTQVSIVTNTQNGVSHNVINTVESQVLGASTELPATGANTFWLYVAFALITGGISIGALGWFLRRKYA